MKEEVFIRTLYIVSLLRSGVRPVQSSGGHGVSIWTGPAVFVEASFFLDWNESRKGLAVDVSYSCLLLFVDLLPGTCIGTLVV